MAGEAGRIIPKRIPSVLEEQILFWMDRCHDSHLQMVIYLEGQVDEVVLGRAVRLTLDAEPVLGCRFVTNLRTPYWERRDDLDAIRHVHLVRSTHPERSLREFFDGVCVDAGIGPQVIIWIVRSGSADTICIKVNHVAMDGRGVKEYGYLLASVYSKLKDDAGFRPETTPVDKRSLLQVSRNLSVFDKLKVVRRSFRDFAGYVLPITLSASCNINKEPSCKALSVRRLNMRTFQDIRKSGKYSGYTVNDIVVAAFIKSFYEIVNPDPNALRRLVTTCDLRRYIPDTASLPVCNLSGFVYLDIGKNRTMCYREILEMVRDQMRRRKADYIGLGNLPVSMLIFKLLPFTWAMRIHDKISDIMKRQTMTTGNVSLLFSNIGVIDLSRLRFHQVKAENAYITTPSAYPPVFAVSLSGCDTGLTIAAGFYENTISRGSVERLFDNVEREILGGN